MTSFDDRIHAGLSRDDESFLSDLEGNRGLFTQLGATFTGPMKYWTAIVTVVTFLVFLAAIWCGWQAFQAEATKLVVLWTGAALAAFLAVGLMKMWIFMRMNHLGTLREIKLLELRVARLKEG